MQKLVYSSSATKVRPGRNWFQVTGQVFAAPPRVQTAGVWAKGWQSPFRAVVFCRIRIISAESAAAAVAGGAVLIKISS